MSVHLRAEVQTLPAYVPGKSMPGAVKLSSNEVAAGPLPSAAQAISDHIELVHRYPDMGTTSLLAALSGFLKVDQSHLAVGAGSVSICQQLVQITCDAGDEVAFPWRSFEQYPIVARVAGAKPVMVPLTSAHALDLDALVDAITPKTRLVFVCSPNNPSGTLVSASEIERFLDSVPDDVLVALDEAYWEFVTDPAAPNGVHIALERSNVVSLRTFSKAYGLAGMRVGYAVGSTEIVQALRKVAVPFGVSTLAQAAAVASLDAADEMAARRDQVVAERERVRSDLLALGYEVPVSQANFVWLPLAERAEIFNQHCIEHGVVVRAFAGEGTRVTIGTPTENDLFLQAAKDFSA